MNDIVGRSTTCLKNKIAPLLTGVTCWLVRETYVTGKDCYLQIWSFCVAINDKEFWVLKFLLQM